MRIKELFVDYAILFVLVAVFIFGAAVGSVEVENVKLTDVKPNVYDGDSVKFVTEQGVAKWMNSDSLRGLWHRKSTLNSFKLEKIIKTNPYVASVQVYGSTSGVLSIDIKQKDILFRLVTKEGDDIYIDSDFKSVPISQNYVASVQVVSCDRSLFKILTRSEKKVVKNNDYLHNLCNFVKLVENDAFWSKMVVQISINKLLQVEITPRVGTHIATICSLKNVEESKAKLQRLKLFYDRVLSPKNEWAKYSHIDVDYTNVLVAKR